MAETERTRTREKGTLPADNYEFAVKLGEEIRERSKTGKIVIRPSDRQWEISRQGRLMYYMMMGVYKDVPLQDWRVFVQDIKTHSGKHRHQGGLVIYVIEGRGYSIVDGERKDWDAGDLLLLPMKPDGVEHQHFNLEPGKGCKWIAFLHEHVLENVSFLIQQIEEAPMYKAVNP
jgi:hypothetical protein